MRLAAEANERENRRIIEEVEARNQQLQALWEQQREEQREQEVDLLSEFDLPLDEQQDEDGRSLCSASTAAPAPPPLSPSSLTVYDRLAARGRSHAEKRLNWEPPDDDVRQPALLFELIDINTLSIAATTQTCHSGGVPPHAEEQNNLLRVSPQEGLSLSLIFSSISHR